MLTVDKRDDPEGNLRLKRHWARAALERLERPAMPRGSQYSYNLFAISDQGLELARTVREKKIFNQDGSRQ